MERLTKRVGKLRYLRIDGEDWGIVEVSPVCSILFDRLEPYEQTGLTPSDITAIQAENQRLQADNTTLEKAASGYCEAMNAAKAELAEYKRAEQEGRMVRVVKCIRIDGHGTNDYCSNCGGEFSDYRREKEKHCPGCGGVIIGEADNEEQARAALKP